MNIVGIAKVATSIVVSTGVGAIVSNTINASIPAKTAVKSGLPFRNDLARFTMRAGGFVLSGLVAEAAVKYAEAQIDGAVQSYKDAKEAVITVVKVDIPKQDPEEQTIGQEAGWNTKPVPLKKDLPTES